MKISYALKVRHCCYYDNYDDYRSMIIVIKVVLINLFIAIIAYCLVFACLNRPMYFLLLELIGAIQPEGSANRAH